jgi:hypothetical protein
VAAPLAHLIALALGANDAALAADAWSSPHPAVELLSRTTGGSTPQRIEAAFVDLCVDGVQARATRYDERRVRTSTWANQTDAFVAVNGAFFSYTDYDAVGWSVGEGEVWPTAYDEPTFSAIGFADYGRARVFEPSEVPFPATVDWWRNVVPGRPLLVVDGQVIQESCFSHMCERHPRTAVGLSADGQTAILVTVDGRQTGATGMTRLELAALMAELGADDAINMDGGGSTTMVVNGAVRNRPSDGSERVVASHLGFVEGAATPCCVREVVPGSTGTFADMPAGHWALGYAEALYTAGITSGCETSPERLFCPNCVADRAQVGVMIARAMGLTPLPEHSFDDVPDSAWYADWVEALRDAGVTSGCSTRAFCPERLATRMEVATFVFRAGGYAAATPTGRFSDLSASQAPIVEALADACVVAGCGAGQFCPDRVVTRAELAKLIAVGLGVGPYGPCGPDDTDPGDTDPTDTDTGSDTSPIDTADTGASDDSDSDDASESDDTSEASEDSDSGSEQNGGRIPGPRCGCASGGPREAGVLVLFGLLFARRRR